MESTSFIQAIRVFLFFLSALVICLMLFEGWVVQEKYSTQIQACKEKKRRRERTSDHISLLNKALDSSLNKSVSTAKDGIKKREKLEKLRVAESQDRTIDEKTHIKQEVIHTSMDREKISRLVTLPATPVSITNVDSYSTKKDISATDHKTPINISNVGSYTRNKPVLYIKQQESCPNLPLVYPNIQEQQEWVPVAHKSEHFSHHVFSAYLDVRDDFARVNIIAYQSMEPVRLYCQLWYQHDNGSLYNRVVHTNTDYVYRMCGGKRYLQVKLACDIEPSPVPYAVSVTESPCDVPVTSLPIIDARVPANLSDSFAVCMKPIHKGYNRTVQLVEFIELSRLFGANHFTLYDYFGDRAVLDPVIKEYERQGLLEVINWKLSRKVWDHRLNSEEERFLWGVSKQCTQVLAQTECLYRNLHRYKYIGFYDLDEMLVPAYNRTWLELINSIPKNYSSYIFHNRFFPLREWIKEDLTKYRDPLLMKYKPVSLTYTQAESQIDFSRPKFIVLGQGVAGIRIHHVRHISNFHQYIVPVEEGLMWHYRARPMKHSKIPQEKDKYMFKFKDILLSKMDAIFKKTGARIVN